MNNRIEGILKNAGLEGDDYLTVANEFQNLQLLLDELKNVDLNSALERIKDLDVCIGEWKLRLDERDAAFEAKLREIKINLGLRFAEVMETIK